MRGYILLIALLVLCVAYYWNVDTFKPESLSGKRVLVTGSSQGLGEEIAVHYAKFGASVVITARNKQRLEKVLERCRDVGRKDRVYHLIKADMEDKWTPAAVIQEAVWVLGGLDVIVLNHAAFGNFDMWTGSDVNNAELDVIMAVNMRSYVHLASLAFPQLETMKGSIGVVSSVGARLPVMRGCLYGASKAALDAFFGSWDFELKFKKSNVSITLASLGLIDTFPAHARVQRIFGFDNEAVGYALPQDAALAVIKGITLRHERIYFPVFGRLWVMLHDMAPNVYESLVVLLRWRGA